MSQDLLASKVVVFEEDPKVRGIPSGPTSVAGAVGVAEQGPFNKAILCTSFDEYQDNFGGFTVGGSLALAAMGFFENGGSQLWVSRIANTGGTPASVDLTATDPTPPGPAVIETVFSDPVALSNNDSLVVTISGQSYTYTFTGTAASIVSRNAEPYALSDNSTLGMIIDSGDDQTFTFHTGDFVDINAATAAEVCAVINATLTGAFAEAVGGSIHVTSNSLGTASRVQGRSGSVAYPLGLLENENEGTGSAPNLAAVTLEDVQALINSLGGPMYVERIDDDVTLLRFTTWDYGASVTLQVTGAAGAAFGFDTDVHTGAGSSDSLPVVHVDAKAGGVAGNLLYVQIDYPTDGGTGEFNLIVYLDGNPVETFENLSRVPATDRYIETVINDSVTGSQYVTVTDLSNFPEQAPDFTASGLSGGVSGDPVDADFIGDEAAKTGLHALDPVQDLSLLLVPGKATPGIHQGMLQYCEVARDGNVFAILDPPANTSAQDMVTYVTTTASLENSSEYGAIYWPQVKVLNPDKGVFGTATLIAVPPSGIIAGVYARTDAARPGGVYDSPAGIELGRLFGVLDFDNDDMLEEQKRDLVYPHRINPLTSDSELPRFIDGSRTLKGDGNFPSIGERRGVIFIERSLRQGLSFARHKKNTAELRAQVRRTITAFLLTQMNNDAFRSREPAKAFFVDVSDQLNTPSVIAAGKLIARVGLATNRPAEFVVLQISQDTRGLDAELQGG